MAEVRIRWIDSPAPATGFKIFRNDVEITDIGLGLQEYVDSNAPDDATPKYEVQSYDGVGGETTQEVEGVNMDYIDTSSGPVAPDAPTVLAAGTPTETEIPLTWVQSATGAMTNYRVYIGGVLQQTFGDVALGTLTGLTAETTYNNITVRAWDGSLESVDSNSINATTEAAPAIASVLDLELSSDTGTLIYTPVGDSDYSVDGGSTWTAATSGVQVVQVATNRNCHIRQTAAGATLTGVKFSTCADLLHVHKCDASNFTELYQTFWNAVNLSSISNLTGTSHITSFREMCRGTALTSMPDFDSSSATNFFRAFYDVDELTNVSNLDVSNASDLGELFKNSGGLLTISNLDTSSGTNFTRMFDECSALQTIDCLDTRSGVTMTDMFLNCTALTDPDAGEQAALVAGGGATTCP